MSPPMTWVSLEQATGHDHETISPSDIEPF